MYEPCLMQHGATWCKNWLVHVCQYLACKDGTVQVRSSGRIGLKADFGSNAPWLVKRHEKATSSFFNNRCEAPIRLTGPTRLLVEIDPV